MIQKIPGKKASLRAPRFLRVKPSTYGKGIFTDKRIEEDKEIATISGRITSDEFSDPRYSMELDNELYLIPRSPYRFLNHSCDPNCELFMYDEDKQDPETQSRPLLLGARRTIETGEELTIDYGWPAHFAIPCGCGVRTCRGWIVDEEELEFIEKENPLAAELSAKAQS